MPCVLVRVELCDRSIYGCLCLGLCVAFSLQGTRGEFRCVLINFVWFQYINWFFEAPLTLFLVYYYHNYHYFLVVLLSNFITTTITMTAGTATTTLTTITTATVLLRRLYYHCCHYYYYLDHCHCCHITTCVCLCALMVANSLEARACSLWTECALFLSASFHLLFFFTVEGFLVFTKFVDTWHSS